MMDCTAMRQINNQRSRRSIASSLLILLVALTTPDLHSQNPGSPGLISIRLEQRKGNSVQAVPQNTVFRNGDILRFRLASQIDGYLYVVDKGTTGSTAVLFPGTSAANNTNHIEMNHSYLVPADGDGWFEVSGPSGFDTLYFLVSGSPIALPAGPQAENPDSAHPQSTPPPPPDLLPRCDDAIFKARGECLDGSAGVAPLPPGAAVPRELVPLARTASRDIVLTNDGDDTAIQSAPTAKLPLIYTFRLAHRE
jgi:hypothetical protein